MGRKKEEKWEPGWLIIEEFSNIRFCGRYNTRKQEGDIWKRELH